MIHSNKIAFSEGFILTHLYDNETNRSLALSYVPLKKQRLFPRNRKKLRGQNPQNNNSLLCEGQESFTSHEHEQSESFHGEFRKILREYNKKLKIFLNNFNQGGYKC